jgi:hypothetical protein
VSREECVVGIRETKRENKIYSTAFPVTQSKANAIF